MPQTTISKEERLRNPSYSYYNRENANFIRSLIQKMIAENSPIKLEESNFKKSIGTLEKMVNRGTYYLMDNCETEDKIYLRWRNSVYIKRLFILKCVLITWKAPHIGLFVSADYKLPTLTGADYREAKKQDTIRWESAVEEFVCGEGESNRLEITGLALTDSEVKIVKSGVVTISSIRVEKIDNSSIILERI